MDNYTEISVDIALILVYNDVTRLREAKMQGTKRPEGKTGGWWKNHT